MNYLSLDDPILSRFRLISYDRPGYGRSSAMPGRTVADCAEDVRAIADALELTRFAVLGISAGGPHALAAAALLPERVVAAATLCCAGPPKEASFDPDDGRTLESIARRQLVRDDPTTYRSGLEEQRDFYLAATPEQVEAVHAVLISEAPFPLSYLFCTLERVKEGYATGIEGEWEDAQATSAPWGFALGSIKVPVQMWHGMVDSNVPYEHTEWIATQITGSELHITSADNHLSLTYNHMSDAIAWLGAHF